MTLIHRLSLGLLFATVPAALAAQGVESPRGMTFSMAIAIDSGGRKTDMSMRFEVLGSKFRMSTMFGSAEAQLDMYMLIDSAAGTFTTVMPAQSMASVMSSSMLDSAAAGYSMDLDGTPKFDVVDLGAGEPILGHATRHYRQTGLYVSKTTIGADVCSNTTHTVADYWTTSELDAADMLASTRRFFPGSARGPLAMKLDSIRKATMKGVALRQVTAASIVVAGADTLDVRTTFELTELKPGSVDPNDFAIPQGFRVIDLRAMQSVDPVAWKQGQATAQANLRERLKKQLCGSSGAGNP